MLSAFETLLDRMPPAWVRKMEIEMLMEAFATAFAVDSPSLAGASADEALAAFRDFTAACMEAALEDAGAAATYRARLGEEARRLGARVRTMFPVRRQAAFRLVRFFYRGIEIELKGDVPGDLQFGPCSFAQRYSPQDCWFMSAFDEGFICGMLGVNGRLGFSCRLTEGASCCRARMEELAARS